MGQITTAMVDLLEQVEHLANVDAEHKRGFKLSERSPADVLIHTIEELTEVVKAETQEDKVQEFGDVLSCLFHFAHKMDINPEEAAFVALTKLKLDFPKEEVVNASTT